MENVYRKNDMKTHDCESIQTERCERGIIKKN